MQGFKVGQTVRIANNAAAVAYGLESQIGKLFEVADIEYYRDFDGNPAYDLRTEEGFFICEGAAEAVEPEPKTTFQAVAAMNTAFGNPVGDPKNVNWDKIRSQFKNVFDEYCEGLVALGIHPDYLDDLRDAHKDATQSIFFAHTPRPEDFRDAVADIKVFADGCSHLAGYDGDADMHLVVDAVMTRFIKDESDKAATIALHAAKGVTEVYFEGEYPTMVMKSSVDQPDAPRGKFLKSSSTVFPVFPEA